MGFTDYLKEARLDYSELDVEAIGPDIAHLVINALRCECAVLFGTTRNRSAITVRFYEPGDDGSTIYCDDIRTFADVVKRLRSYVSAVDGRSPNGPQGRS